MLGDANADGNINAADVSFLINFIQADTPDNSLESFYEWSQNPTASPDLNNDGVIDLLEIIKKYSEDFFPIDKSSEDFLTGP